MRLDELERAVRNFAAGSPLNIVEELESLCIYDAPLLGVAAASDPLFASLKERDVVGVRHKSPGEWVNGATTVIAYFLPFTPEVRTANRSGSLPAMEWLYGRVEGEAFNNALRSFLVDYLRAAGYQAVAPALDSRFSVERNVSNWSERHVAFIAGLGTFSLNASLITKCGAAGRLGSVVTDLEIAATPRHYLQKDEYCTKCGICITRCPAGAVHGSGKEHGPCEQYLKEMGMRFKPRYGCGKCQTAVPCEAGIPKR